MGDTIESDNEWTDSDNDSKNLSHLSKKRKKHREKQSYKNLNNISVNFMGFQIIHDQDKAPHNLNSISLPNNSCRVLSLVLEDGVEATGAEAFSTVYNAVSDHITKSENVNNIIPNSVELNGKTANLNYIPPQGDEIFIGQKPEDTQWLQENRFLGTITISPNRFFNSNSSYTSSNDWELLKSFPTWHKFGAQGSQRLPLTNLKN